jgi:hypothetical protein
MIVEAIFSVKIRHLNLLLKIRHGNTCSGMFYKAVIVALKHESII